MKRYRAIRDYWVSKVVQSQANIKCQLISFYLDGETVIAEWETEFDDVPQGIRKRMKEIAVLEFEGEADRQPPRILAVTDNRLLKLT